MKILEFVDGIDGGGAGKIVYDYMKYMDKSDVTVDILAFSQKEPPFLEKSFLECGCNVIYIDSRKIGLGKHFKQFEEVLKKGNYDLIHCHAGDWSFPYLFLARKYKVPVRIAHSHIAKCGFSGIKKAVVTFMKLLLPSVATQRYACGIDAGKYLWNKRSFTVMRNAVHCDRFKFSADTRIRIREELNVPDDVMLIIHVGRFCYQKNNEFLVQIADELKNKTDKFLILSVGKGELFDKVKNEVSTKKLDKYFCFLGLRNDVPDLLMGADVFVLPSRYEGLPIVAVEAQASGIYTILSNQVTSEAIINDTTEYLPIQDGAGVWVDAIVKASGINSDRADACEKVKNAGYDIVIQSELLKENYRSYVNNKK